MKNNIRKILINLNFGNIVEGVELFDSLEGIMCEKFKYEEGRLIERTFYKINNTTDMEKLDTFINQIEIKGNNTNTLDQFDDDGTTIDMIIEEIGNTMNVEATLPCGIIDFYNEINEILKYASITDIELILLMISFYYVISTSQEEEYISLQTAINILNAEIELSKQDNEMIDDSTDICSTLFDKFPTEHPVTKLFNVIKNIGRYNYMNILSSTILKISYYNSVCKNDNLMTMSSNEEIEMLAYEIIYFNKGTDELLKNAYSDINAMNEIGERYSYSNLDDEAYKIFETAASKGNKKAMFNKIWCLYKGKGVKRDYELAYTELEKLHNEVSSVKIIEMLGEMYYLGNGTEKNYDKAFEKFSFIEMFNSEAKYYLGQMYLNGHGVEKNEEKAEKYFKDAAEMRNRKAIIFLNEKKELKKDKDFNLNSLFDDIEPVDQTELDKEYEKYAKLYEEKFGKYPTILEPSNVTNEQIIAALKECIDKNMDLLDKILYGGEIKFDKNALY